VDIVLIHWNQAARCLTAVERYAAQDVPVRLTVVDNASRPDEVAQLREGVAALAGEFDRAPVLLEQTSNLGWGPGLNVGLRRWLDDPDGSEWCGVAPHDALVAEGCLRRIVEEGARRPGAGLISADVGDGMTTVIDRAFGPVIVPARVTTGWEPMDYPHGTLFLARRACLDEIGLFDERYFAYCEEADLGERARRAGWEVGIVRGADVRNPVTSGRIALVDYLEERNTLLLVRDNFGRWPAFVRLVLGLWMVARGWRRPDRRRDIYDARARLQAMADHLRGRYGPPPDRFR
jgi:GT2 family glycosyltransferase